MVVCNKSDRRLSRLVLFARRIQTGEGMIHRCYFSVSGGGSQLENGVSI